MQQIGHNSSDVVQGKIERVQREPTFFGPWRFSVAPMMDWSDRHCRFFHRLLTRRARLYTEMVTADAVVFGPRERLIGFDAFEHPVALQLGGADPARLAAGRAHRRGFRL